MTKTKIQDLRLLVSVAISGLPLTTDNLTMSQSKIKKLRTLARKLNLIDEYDRYKDFGFLLFLTREMSSDLPSFWVIACAKEISSRTYEHQSSDIIWLRQQEEWTAFKASHGLNDMSVSKEILFSLLREFPEPLTELFGFAASLEAVQCLGTMRSLEKGQPENWYGSHWDNTFLQVGKLGVHYKSGGATYELNLAWPETLWANNC